MEQPPFRYRHDGWTPERQAAFLLALRETTCVRAACARVGLSPTSARRARTRMTDFAESWDAALRFTAARLEKAAFERAVEGWTEPVVSGGQVIAEKRRYSDRLLSLLIRREDARREAAAEARRLALRRAAERRQAVEFVAAEIRAQEGLDPLTSGSQLGRMRDEILRIEALRKEAEEEEDEYAAYLLDADEDEDEDEDEDDPDEVDPDEVDGES